MQVSYFANKYAGKCFQCGIRVAAYSGICFTRDTKWCVGCASCCPAEYAAINAKSIAAAQSHEAKLQSLEEARLLAVAQRKALIEEMGIELDKPFDQTYRQNSWSDDSTWKVPFNGSGSAPEIRRVMETRAQSLSGALRASQGARVQSIDWENKFIQMSESVSLCD